jgi:alkylation response protein AidB-like acyl-CoA dehydrogenase
VYSGMQFDPEWAAHVVKDMQALADDNRQLLDHCTRSGTFPAELYQEMGSRGWVGPITPADQGGMGKGVQEYCLILEEVGRTGLVSPQVSIQGQKWLLEWGTSEQKDKYLKGIASGMVIFSESISEPGVGSSLKLMQATATPDGSDWILRASKTHVNLGHQSDVTIVYAMAPQGLTAFLVDTDLPGVSTQQTEPIGLRLIPTADVLLKDVRVPSSAVLGAPGQGMATFLSTFNMSRLGNASELLGLARRALGMSVRYAQERRVGEGVVTDFQGIQWVVADRFTALFAAALVRDRAAVVADAGQDHALETSLAKSLCIDAAEQAVNEVYALIGGHGLYHEQLFGQLLFDVKVLRVAGGSREVLRNHIASRVLKSASLEGLA